VDHFSTLASTGTWESETDELLKQWAVDARKLAERQQRKADKLKRFGTREALVILCMVMGLLSLIFSGETMRWASSLAFLTVAVGHVALEVNDSSGRAERYHNNAIKYCDMLDEINAVVKAPYSRRPPPDMFLTRMRERLKPAVRPVWSGFR